MINDDWFAGFFDGEGSISCLALVDKKFKRKVVFRISISQREDEFDLLRKIKERFGGRIYKSNREKFNMCMWYIDGPLDIFPFIKFFDEHPLQTKKNEEWKLVKPLLLERYKKIEEGKKYTTKYITDEYWEKVWDVSMELSKMRGTWTHLKKKREAIIEQRGRPTGIKEIRPRKPKRQKADLMSIVKNI